MQQSSCVMDYMNFIESLIENVKKRRCLYDKTDCFYYNRTEREKAWKEISKICGRSDGDCRYRWKLLRESFVREMKRISLAAGSGIYNLEEWRFLRPLTFLKDYLQPRRKRDHFEDLDMESTSGNSILSGDNLQEDILTAYVPLKKKLKLSPTATYPIDIEENEIKPDLDALQKQVAISDPKVTNTENEETKLLENLKPRPSKHCGQSQNEYHHLSSHWSQKLTNMDNIQRILAEKLISDVLFNGELGLLNFNTSVTNLSPYQNANTTKDGSK